MKISLVGTIRSLMRNSSGEKKTNVSPSASRSMPTTSQSQLTGLTEIRKPNKLRKPPPYNLGNDSSSSFGCVDGLELSTRLDSLPNNSAPLSPGEYENPRRAPLPPGGSYDTQTPTKPNSVNQRSGSSVVGSLINKYQDRSPAESLTSGCVYSQASADNLVAKTGIHAGSRSDAVPPTAQRDFPFLSEPPAVKYPTFLSPKGVKPHVHAHREKVLNELKAKENRAGISFLDMVDSDTDS